MKQPDLGDRLPAPGTAASHGPTAPRGEVTPSPKDAAAPPYGRRSGPARRAEASARGWRSLLTSEVTFVAVLLCAVWLLPLGRYQLTLSVALLIYAIAGTGMNVLVGLAGIISVGHAAFMGVGGYAWALTTGAGAPHYAAWTMGIASSVVVALVVAIFLQRFSDYYFALATVAIGLLLPGLATMLPDLTGGSAGLRNVPYTSVMGLPRQESVFILAGACLLAALILQRLLRHSGPGLILIALRSREVALPAIGAPRRTAQALAFTISGALAGVAGVLLAQSTSFVDPSQYHFSLSVGLLLIPVVAGRGWLWAPVVGALVAFGLPDLFRTLDEWRLIFYGLIILFIPLVAPRGLVGLPGLGLGLLRRLRR